MMGVGGSLVTRMGGMLSLDEIALGLSRLPRFGGQTTIDWTVAQHSLVTHQFGRWMALD